MTDIYSKKKTVCVIHSFSFLAQFVSRVFSCEKNCCPKRDRASTPASERMNGHASHF